MGKMKEEMVQALLNIAGFPCYIDGNIGPLTRKVVKDFQKKHNIKVDGIPGPQTQYELMFYKYPHFRKEEFKCKCGKYCNGYPVKVDEKLLVLLEKIRVACGNRPININSAIRCNQHNKNVGGASGSQHLLGKAVDIKISGVSPKEVQKQAISINTKGGTGKYNTFTHVDVRGKRTVFNG